MSKPSFFHSAAEFRSWLAKNHDRSPELLVGFYRVDSDRGGLTYRQALDEALCFGWIDGVRRSYDSCSYTIRFSPRIAGSIWSVVNTRRMLEAINLDRVDRAGLRVFQQRDEKKSKLYSYEVGNCKFDHAFEKQFRAKTEAWEFYRAQAPWYRRTSCYWVMSAKKEETRQRRLATLIRDSEAGRRIKQLVSNPKKSA